jgi:hypothetical protein
MGKVKADWHAKHRMPPKAALNQRVKWHLAHARACGCREIPKSILAELRARGVAPPARRGSSGGRARRGRGAA